MDVRVHPVELAAADGVVLRGQLWGDGPDWIILLHERGEDRDLDVWRPLLPSIMAPERTVLTVDLRGHGASDGEWDDTLPSYADISVLVAFAQSSGAAWIALAGAGDSATRILEYSSASPIDASILLSPTYRDGQAPTLRGRGEAKLFAVGSWSDRLSAGIRAGIREARNRSIGWAMLVSMPTDAQGTDLLTGAYSDQLIERIVTFLSEQRMLARRMLPGCTDAS